MWVPTKSNVLGRSDKKRYKRVYTTPKAFAWYRHFLDV